MQTDHAFMAQVRQPSALLLRSLLGAAMALPMLVFYAIGALGPYQVADLGVPETRLDYLTMSAFALAALLSLWAGAIVDRLGGRRALGLLFGAYALAYALAGLLPGFYGLVIALAICGAAQALANPATNLLIAENLPVAERAATVGFEQARVQVSALFAWLLLPAIAQGLGWRTALVLFAPIALLLGCIGMRSLPARQAGKAGLPITLQRPSACLALLMAVQCCVAITLSSFVTYLGVYARAQDMPAVLAGSLVAVFGLMGILARVLLTPLAARMKDESLMLGVLCLPACGAGGLQCEPGWPAVLVVALGQQYGHGADRGGDQFGGDEHGAARPLVWCAGCLCESVVGGVLRWFRVGAAVVRFAARA
ncbi:MULTISPECIES: MFS transporter [Pseudomonas]|uniref:MFS transporter n=1 Tax=Pseudomonas farsensis TaxID=2745492 RepID=A0ABU8QMG0_9PSED|nr:MULTISPECIES: MFS transporter [Pseudomonas]